MTKIFVEGKDQFFIESYIQFLIQSDLLQGEVDFSVIPVGGWTNLEKASNTLKDNSDSNGTNLVIFDADEHSNNGGFEIRKSAINEIGKASGLIFDLFLFPNNQDDGDFESLLEKIVNSNHIGLLKCFANYEQCISNFKRSDGTYTYQLPIRKARIYSYVDAFPKSRKQNEKFKNKGDYFFNNTEMWNLESEHLSALRNFLISSLNKK
jgi:hypothetical protein